MNLNWKSFFIGTAFGIASGYAIKETLSQKTNISSEKVLNHVKKQFKVIGPVTGSWIHMEAEALVKNQLTYKVYKGGITQGSQEQYEFIADATTGTILEVNPLT